MNSINVQWNTWSSDGEKAIQKWGVTAKERSQGQKRTSWKYGTKYRLYKYIIWDKIFILFLQSPSCYIVNYVEKVCVILLN